MRERPGLAERRGASVQVLLLFRRGLCLVIVLFALAAGVPATAQDPAAGRALAEQWCTSCHIVAPGAGSSDQVPSLQSIVQDRGRSEEWLRTWLSAPHESMPSLSLSRMEIVDLVAYLESLRATE